MKYVLSLLLVLFIETTFAQRVIKQTFKNNKVKELEIGDMVRVSFPAAKLNDSLVVKKNKEFIGVNATIKDITENGIVLKTKQRKTISLNLEDIQAIKKSNSAGFATVLIGSYAIIGGAAIILGSQADVNPAVTSLVAAVSVIPATFIASGIFYPSIPKQKVGKKYRLEIVNDSTK